MKQMEDDILLLQELLNVNFPQSYVDVLNTQVYADTSAGILGLPVSLDLSSAWGATEFLRIERPDLGDTFVVIKITGSTALCLDLKSGNKEDAPVVEIDLEGDAAPTGVSESLQKYLAEPESNSRQEILRLSNAFDSDNAYWFQRGLERLDWHIKSRSFQYDHKEGGRLPRSHVWRPYRFCVQDIILGITVIRHDQRYNRLDVDVFLTSEIPEYEADSGCHALALILLSDAYKSGGSMEIKFTEHVEGGSAPLELCRLAKKLEVDLKHADKGGITPKEAKELYLALSGLRPEIREKVLAMENEKRLSAASVCYALHHGVWTAQELEVILYSSRFPDTILKGSFPAEAWHLFHHDLFCGRNALMGGYLDRRILRREHAVKEADDNAYKVVELEEDEREVEISFDADYCAKIYRNAENDAMRIPWLHNELQQGIPANDQRLLVLLRARDTEDMKLRLDHDLKQAIQLKVNKAGTNDIVCIMLPSDYKRLDMSAFTQKAAENNIGIIICTEFLNQLNQEVGRRFESIKVMRK